MQKMDDRMTSSLFELQLDLENSLRLLTRKYNELSKKFTVNNDKKDDKLKASDIGERRASISDSKPYKKIKVSSEKTQKSSLSARAKSKRTQPAKSQESGFLDKSDVPKVQKNDSPSRFWAFIDCYCTDIKTEDISILEKWIESHERDSDYQNVPELGVHYSSKWMEEDILEERKESSKSMENPKGTDYLSFENDCELEILKQIQKKIAPLYSNHPPLVENLMSSLVQENIITSNDIMTETIPDDDCPENKKGTMQSMDDTLESRLRSQLAALGILGTSNMTVEDELFQELKRLQSLLIPISELNCQKKKALLSRAKAEIAKQEAQKRIQEADAKVMESYRIMTSARLKGKKLSKKELSQIRNMLEERDTLIRNTRIES